MYRLIACLLGLLVTTVAHAQSVQQSGAVTPGHMTCWVTTGVVNDCGTPTTTPYLLTSAPYTLTDAATVTPDLNLAQQFNWTLTASGHTLANPLNLTSAQLGQRVVFYIVQGGSGSYTMTWGSVYKFAGGTKPTLTTTVGALDRVVCDIQTTSALTCTATLNFQ